MSKVVADITMSLDGYVSPVSGSVDELQNWVMNPDSVDERATAATGAVIMGRRLFDIVNGRECGRARWPTVRGRPGDNRSSSSPTRCPMRSA